MPDSSAPKWRVSTMSRPFTSPSMTTALPGDQSRQTAPPGAGEFEVGRQEAREGRQLTVSARLALPSCASRPHQAQPALAELPAVRRQAQTRRRG